MAERPILFSGDMVRAILACRKTQTRLVVKPQPGDLLAPWPTGSSCICFEDVLSAPDYYAKAGYCPFGVPGDTLWVRETWGAPDCDRPGVPDGRKPQQGDRIVYLANEADAWHWREGMPWRSSIHMPRWASRLTLRVTGVRVERVREISEEDAQAEGITYEQAMAFADEGSPDYIAAFQELWIGIYGEQSWQRDWVWVVEFEKEAPHA